MSSSFSVPEKTKPAERRKQGTWCPPDGFSAEIVVPIWRPAVPWIPIAPEYLSPGTAASRELKSLIADVFSYSYSME